MGFENIISSTPFNPLLLSISAFLSETGLVFSKVANSASIFFNCHSKFLILASCFFTTSLYTLSENLKVPFSLSFFAFSNACLVLSNSSFMFFFSTCNCVFDFCSFLVLLSILLLLLESTLTKTSLSIPDITTDISEGSTLT